MNLDNAIVKGEFVLEKFPGKGGWTYVALPKLQPDKRNPFGWLRVQGFIDGYNIKQYHLMPMGNGNLFLPVKAPIRKAIKKQVNDLVSVVLYPDDSKVEIPEELLVCFKTDPDVYERFMSSTDGVKKEIIDWIYDAKTETTKVNRIAKAMKRIEVLSRKKR